MSKSETKYIKETVAIISNGLAFLGWLYFLIFMCFAISSTKIYMTNRQDVIKEIQSVWDSSVEKPMMSDGMQFSIELGKDHE